MTKQEYNADYTCPICLRVTKHNDRHRHDIGLRTYIMCKSCFSTLEGIRNVERAEIHKHDIREAMEELMDGPNDFFECFILDGYTKEDIINEFKRILDYTVDEPE